jgi:energy-coupling factor transport system ATP-binding protein
MSPENTAAFEFDAELLRNWDAGIQEESPEKTGEPLLEIDDLNFSYPGDLLMRPVLEHISLVIRRGECASLVGKNGAGKSTLARIICGFNRPVSGTLRFDGKNLESLSIRERAEHIGYVMQNPNQMISFPMIYDETALGLRTRGGKENEIRDRVFEILNICGLYPFRNWPVSALSYGQKKRLSVASILVTSPSLLILDEPTAGQDFRHYSDIMEFLKGLNREQGLTILMITHDMHLMLEYTERAIVLADGKLVSEPGAAPAEILTDDRIIAEASLKRTSLYDLALRAGLDDPRAFVRRFISRDRRIRGSVLSGRGPAGASR